MVSGWERIYQQQGDLGYAVLPKVIRAARVFRQRGYRDVLDLGCGTGKHAIFLARNGSPFKPLTFPPPASRSPRRKLGRWVWTTFGSPGKI